MKEGNETLALFSRPTADWLRERRSALREAAQRADRGRELPPDRLKELAHRVARPFALDLPRLVTGDEGVSIRRADDRLVRVRLRVEGDASLLTLCPSNPDGGRGRLPAGVVAEGAVVGELKAPVTRQAVEAYRAAVAGNLARLAEELNTFWTAGLVGSVLEQWREAREAAERARQKQAEAARELSTLGYPVEG